MDSVSRLEVHIAAGTASGAGGDVAVTAVLVAASETGLTGTASLPKARLERARHTGLSYKPVGTFRAVVEEVLGLHAGKQRIYVGMSDRLPLLRRSQTNIMVAQNPHLYGRVTRLPTARQRFRILLLRSWAKYSARRADWIVTATTATQAEVVETTGVPLSRVFVRPIPPQGATTVKTHHESDLHRLVLIGDIYTYKRFDEAVRTVDQWAQEAGLELEVTHIGRARDGHGARNLNRAIASSKQLSFRLLGCLSHELTMAELAAADLFLFPSERESYGLPLAEALALGVPAICRDIPQFRELAGPAASYFCSPADLVASLSHCRPLQVREQMSAVGRARITANTGWDVLSPST